MGSTDDQTRMRNAAFTGILRQAGFQVDYDPGSGAMSGVKSPADLAAERVQAANADAQAKAGAVAERKRRGMKSTILTGPAGLLEPAPTARGAELLGG